MTDGQIRVVLSHMGTSYSAAIPGEDGISGVADAFIGLLGAMYNPVSAIVTLRTLLAQEGQRMKEADGAVFSNTEPSGYSPFAPPTNPSQGG